MEDTNTTSLRWSYPLLKSLPQNKPELLKQWDRVTEGPVYASLLYWIDNEIHHRGQGYVYLRSLGIEPPPFWDRQ